MAEKSEMAKKSEITRAEGAGTEGLEGAASYGAALFTTPAALLLIAALAGIIYSNTLGAAFQFDDISNIVQNREIKDLYNFWPPSGSRYLTYLSFAVNYRLGGLDPTGYHLFNLAVHVINAVLVWALVLGLFGTPVMARAREDFLPARAVALAAALLFVSHPIQTQAVTYITQRFASMATMWYLASLVLYLKWRNEGLGFGTGRGVALYALTLAAAAAAMLTKEISTTLPVVMVLVELGFYSGAEPLKKRLVWIAPFFVLVAIIPIMLFGPELGLGAEPVGYAEVVRARQIKDLTLLSPRVYFFTQLRVIMTYLRLLVMPVGQNVDYDYSRFRHFLRPEVALSFLFLLSLAVSSVVVFIRSRKKGAVLGLLISTGVVWFFVTLSIESSFIPIFDLIFEHRLYLPSVGAAIAAGSCMIYVFRRIGAGPASALITIVILVAVPLGAAAFVRNRVWHDEITFWQDVISKSPLKDRGHANLGRAYFEEGMIEEALEKYRYAVHLNPGFSETRYNLGMIYNKMGLEEKALVELKRAIEFDPDHAKAHYILGNIYNGHGRYAEAVVAFEDAVRSDPWMPEAHNNLGDAYDNMGRIESAMEHYREAIRVEPDFAIAHNNLGTAYARKGSLAEATGEFLTALAIKPGYVEARFNLALAYGKTGQRARALLEFEKVIAQDPDNDEARDYIKALGARQGR